jgi:hypothetical protein
MRPPTFEGDLPPTNGAPAVAIAHNLACVVERLDALLFVKETARDGTLGELVAAIKTDIWRDVEIGVVPTGVSNFPELHDHVDANMYGNAVLADFGRMDEDDRISLLDRAQTEIDGWLRNGGLRRMRETMREPARQVPSRRHK